MQAGRAIEGLNEMPQTMFGVDFFYTDIDAMNAAANKELDPTSRYARITVEYFDSEDALRAAVAAAE